MFESCVYTARDCLKRDNPPDIKGIRVDFFIY